MMSLPAYPLLSKMMPYTEPGSSRDLQMIANYLALAQKVVVITGAGISTEAGIPVRMLLL